MSEFQSQCGCKIHVTQWSSKRKIASVKYCQKHSGDACSKLSAARTSLLALAEEWRTSVDGLPDNACALVDEYADQLDCRIEEVLK